MANGPQTLFSPFMQHVDFVVVGAGIAGASVAHELASHASVVVLERESQPGYHSTGRSAALFTETYGNDVIRALVRGSREFLFSPPNGFTDVPLVAPRGVLLIASAKQRAAFERLRASPDIRAGTELLTTAQALERVPILQPESAVQAAYEPHAMDLDVNALLQGYLRGLRARGGAVICNAEPLALSHASGRWVVETRGGTYEAGVVVNAAGAWADEVARMVGAAPVGLEPKRRTAVLIDPPDGMDVDGWPLVLDVDESFYFKPDAGKLLLSPADETPSPPCDAQPDDLDVAIAVDRLEQATRFTVRRVGQRWAGLRSFVADRSPVAGFDPQVRGFFWLAGQGGYGIETAPALARVAAALALGHELPGDLQAGGLSQRALSVSRLRGASAR